MFFAITAILFLLICYVIKYIWDKRELYAFTLKMQGPFSIPVIGSLGLLLDFRKDHIAAIDKYLKKYPRWFVSWFLSDLTITTDDPDFIDCILTKSAIAKPPRITKNWMESMGEGVITMPADENTHLWKARHKIISTSLKPSTLKNYFDTMYANNSTMIKFLRPFCGTGEEVDVELFCFRTFSSSATESLFQVHLNFFSGERDVVYRAMLQLDDFVLTKPRKFWFDIPILYKYSNLIKVQDFIFTSFNNLAKEIYDKKEKDLEYKETHDLDDNVMIEGLIKAVRSGFLTKNEAQHEIMNMFPAGVGTVLSSVSHLIGALAMNPKIQERLFREFYDFYHTTGRVDVKYEHIDSFPFLDACCKEILRLFPAGPLTVRRSVEDVVFKKGNMIIPPKVNFVVPTYKIHRDPKVWNKPNSFMPERWLDSVAMSKIPRQLYMPYSYGPRQCSGRHFAQMELKLTTIQLLMSYEFHSREKLEDIPVHAGIMVRLHKNVVVSITERRVK